MKCNNLICASTRGHWHRQNMPTIGEITMNINNIYIYIYIHTEIKYNKLFVPQQRVIGQHWHRQNMPMID